MTDHADEIHRLRASLRATTKLCGATMRALVWSRTVNGFDAARMMSLIEPEVLDTEIRNTWERERKETAAVEQQLRDQEAAGDARPPID